jgi:hypothetical protein
VSSGPPVDLDEARRRLRELGYLDGRVERYVFARAFEGRGGILLPAAAFSALGAAVACVCAVAASEPDFLRLAAGPAILLLHLLAAFLFPCAALAALLGAIADRTRTPAAGAIACAAATAGGIFFLWIAGAYGLARRLPGAALLWGLPVAFVALVAARSVRSGFLARAYAHSRVLPGRRRRGVLAGVAAAGLAVAAAVFASRPEPGAPPSLHVSPRRDRILVVAVDGIPDASADAAFPADLRALFSGAASGWWRQERSSPPELWTTIATGAPSERHGVRALERVRPAGSPTALRAPLGTRWYLRGVGPALALASSAPVSAADRRSLAFWEVAAAAGLPASAIGWWASGPWPGAFVVDNRQVLARASSGEEADRAALDELSRRRADSISTVYLPGPDILRGDPARRAGEIRRVAAYLATEASRVQPGDTVLVVVTGDSHGSPGAIGRAAVFDGRPPAVLSIRAVDVAPSILARAGVPAALDLSGRPVPALFREGSLESLSVETYGPRAEPRGAGTATSDRDYLKKLKSLGYLN